MPTRASSAATEGPSDDQHSRLCSWISISRCLDLVLRRIVVGDLHRSSATNGLGFLVGTVFSIRNTEGLSIHSAIMCDDCICSSIPTLMAFDISRAWPPLVELAPSSCYLATLARLELHFPLLPSLVVRPLVCLSLCGRKGRSHS
jgi:hypothetical protein